MLKKLILLSMLVVLLPISLAQEEESPESQGMAAIRIVHFVPDVGELDLRINGEIMAEDILQYGEWIEIPAGETEIAVIEEGEEPLIPAIVQEFLPNTATSLALIGSQANNSIHFKFISEQRENLPLNLARVSIFYAVEDENILSIEVGDDLRFEEAFYDVDPWQFQIPPSNHPIRFLDGDNVVLELENFEFDVHHRYFITLFLQDDTLQTAIYSESLGADVRIANFSQNTDSLDIWFGEQPAFQQIARETLTNFLNVPIGNYQMRVLPTNSAPEDPILELPIVINEESTYTLAIFEDLNSENPQVVIFDDQLTDSQLDIPLASGTSARIYILHVNSDIGAVDIISGEGTTLISGLTYGAELAELNLPSGVYNLQIVSSENPENIILDLPETLLFGGEVYFLPLSRNQGVLTGYCIRPEGCQ